MALIDFNKQRKEMADKEINTSSISPLEESYNATWGGAKPSTPSVTKAKTGEDITLIELSKISPFKNKRGRKQPFKINKDKIKAIKESAKDIGIITPIIVRPYENGYQILSGHHRFKVAEELKLSTIPCIVRNIADEDVEKYVIEANIQRLKLLPSEYGAILERYMEIRKDFDLTAEDIAVKFGISRKALYRYTNVAKLNERLQEQMDKGIINVDCADVFYTLSTDAQIKLADFIDEYPKTITNAIARDIMDILDNGTIEDFKDCFPIKEKKLYKNDLYNRVYGNVAFDMSEEDLDKLVEKLLHDYFANH